ncbi:hypothetical protein ACFTQL_21800 [Peribacillus butanolivorans]|uniref:hypothetical protein n=1 Tax=Peribacillus butanolivorans TaxID=421767 RepID=UPI0036296682
MSLIHKEKWDVTDVDVANHLGASKVTVSLVSSLRSSVCIRNLVNGTIIVIRLKKLELGKWENI